MPKEVKIVILMGVCGCGKTEVGKFLAKNIGGTFIEGDEFHSPSNIQKMSQSIPLNDIDREVWLKTLRKLIDKQLEQPGYSVLACSALKTNYRNLLRCDDPRIKLVYLKGAQSLIKKRMEKRKGHYMKQTLLESQFDALEEPQNALVVDITASPGAIASLIVKELKDSDTD
jgi:gluconokinase